MLLVLKTSCIADVWCLHGLVNKTSFRNYCNKLMSGTHRQKCSPSHMSKRHYWTLLIVCDLTDDTQTLADLLERLNCPVNVFKGVRSRNLYSYSCLAFGDHRETEAYDKDTSFCGEKRKLIKQLNTKGIHNFILCRKVHSGQELSKGSGATPTRAKHYTPLAIKNTINISMMQVSSSAFL